MVAASPLEALQHLFREHGFVGVVAAGFADAGGSTRWMGAAGLADVDADAELTPERRMPAGSITKLLTSTLVLRLVAEISCTSTTPPISTSPP